MSGGLPGLRVWPGVVRCLIDPKPHRSGHHGGMRECRCDPDVTYLIGLTPCHEPQPLPDNNRTPDEKK